MNVESFMLTRPDWHARANCRGQIDEVFDDPHGAVERFCPGCPVVAECRAAGRHENHGVWGAKVHARGDRRRQRPGSAVLRELSDTRWTTARSLASRLGRSLLSVESSLHFQRSRGTVEHREGRWRRL